MYIDIHAHIGYHALYPEAYMAGMLGPDKQFPQDKIRQTLQLFLRDRDCSAFLKQMDRAGIEKSVLLILDGGVGLGEPELDLEAIFELHHHVLRAHADRFIVFGGADPRRGEKGFELFRKGILEYGFKGLKLYPPMGYAVGDERLQPYYELCSSHKLPVLIHSGPSLPSLHNHFADPAGYVEIIRAYPDIPFILAHLGYRLGDPVVRSLLNEANVWLDITGFQTLDLSVESNRKALGRIFHGAHSHKILFGTDWPLFNLFKPVADHIGLLRQCFSECAGEADPEAFDRIMYRNATAILP